MADAIDSTRRQVLKTIPACGLAAIVPAVAIAEVADPLADVINAYRQGISEFNLIPVELITRENEEAFVMATYGPASDQLFEGAPPATSLRGVREAIRYSLEQDALLDDSAENALRSALTYLDAQA